MARTEQGHDVLPAREKTFGELQRERFDASRRRRGL